MKKRVFSLILCLVMFMNIMPVYSGASDIDIPEFNQGEVADIVPETPADPIDVKNDEKRHGDIVSGLLE